MTGSIGLLGTRPSYEMMAGCDTILTVGSSFPYTQFMPEFGQARGVQIDVDGKQIGMRYPYEVNMVADAKSALIALLPLLEHKADRNWRETIESNVAGWWETTEEQAMIDSDKPGFVNPMRLVWELNGEIPDDAIVAADSGSSANWYARQLKFKGTMRGSLSGNLATMGPGVPYVIGAKFAHPDRPAVATRRGRRHADERHGRTHHGGQVLGGVGRPPSGGGSSAQQRSQPGHVGDAGDERIAQVRRISGAARRRLCGLRRLAGLRSLVVHRPEELRGAWHSAFTADRPMVLDVFTDPDFPTIPPHTTFQQAKDTAKAILSGDPDALGVIRAGLEEKLHEILPGR